MPPQNATPAPILGIELAIGNIRLNVDAKINPAYPDQPAQAFPCHFGGPFGVAVNPQPTLPPIEFVGPCILKVSAVEKRGGSIDPQQSRTVRRAGGADWARARGPNIAAEPGGSGGTASLGAR